MNYTFLDKLEARDYIHPDDNAALDKLKNTKGIETLTKKFYDLGIERVMKLQYTGSGIELSTKNFPRIQFLLKLAMQILNIDGPPPLIYATVSDKIETETIGVEHPVIVLSTECINKLSDEELLFLIGRELGHIQQNHVLYNELGTIFPQLVDALSYVTFGLSGLVSGGLRYALFYWAQMAEYTSDRAGLLACQDGHIAKLLLAKIAGLPEKAWHNYDLSDFEEQARAFDGLSEGTFDKFVRFMYGNNLWAVARAQEIIKWTESGEYSRILARKGSIREIGLT